MLDSYTGQSGSSDEYSTKSSQEYITNKKASLYEDNKARENKYQGLSKSEFLENSRIGENHYIQSGNTAYDFPDETNNYNNFIKSNPEKSRVSSVSKANDPRFASIGSTEYLNNDFDQSHNYNDGVGSKVYSILGGAFEMTKKVASTVKDKAREYELGDKLYHAGEKTASILYSASFTIYEKGTELAKSDTVANIAESAKKGLHSGWDFLYGKVFGPSYSSMAANNNRDQVSSENYSNNNNRYSENVRSYSSEPSQYVKLDDKLDQRFLDD